MQIIIRSLCAIFGIIFLLCNQKLTVFGIEISHLELEVGNRTCGVSSSCMTVELTISNSSSEQNNFNFERNCMCDQKCKQYGDCCVDSAFFNVAEQRRAFANFECAAIPDNEVYVRRECPSSWTNVDVRTKCELSGKNNPFDPLLLTPVTVTKNSITYGNIFCAICHGEREFLEYWETSLQCPTVPNNSQTLKNDTAPNTDTMSENLFYNNQSGFWQIAFDMTYHDCNVVPVMPEKLKSYSRKCIPNIVRACVSSWTNVEIRNRCEAYTSVVYHNDTAYRNIHCAICNNIPVQNLSCRNNSIDIRFTTPTPFSILFDFRGGKTVGKVQPCQDDQLYDPFFKICRDIVADETEVIASDQKERDIRRTVYDTKRPDTEHGPILVNKPKNPVLKCPKFTLNPDDYKLLNNRDIYVPTYDRIFSDGYYSINSDDGVAVVCADSIIGKKLISKYEPYFGVLTLLGIGISIICLCVHLLAFLLVYELRNLSGMNLASFSVALLIAYGSFLAGNTVTGKACFANAIVTYYFFLAAFFWMTTIAFDVWRALRLATAELRVNSGKQWKKFFVYSIWSWLMPAIIVLVAILIELSPTGYIPDNFKPNFGTVSCWFGQGMALLIFLGVPLGVIMALNIGFFASSSCMIYSSQSMTVYSASADTLRNFKLYSRLALIMGLTWIIGLVAGFVDNELLWVLFILLNTTQGLFIFVAFTCRRRVLRVFFNINDVGNSLHLPACSWSTSASYDPNSEKARKQSTKTTSTTYY